MSFIDAMNSKEFEKEILEAVYSFIYEKIKNHSRINENGEIILGNIVELHFSEDGNNLDIYRYVPQEVMEADDDYDFDSDYITTVNLK